MALEKPPRVKQLPFRLPSTQADRVTWTSARHKFLWASIDTLCDRLAETFRNNAAQLLIRVSLEEKSSEMGQK